MVDSEEIKAVQKVLHKGALTSSSMLGGENVRDFEKLMSDYVGSKYAIAVNSGTAALQAALCSLDVKNGDEVLLPSFTFVATANAVISIGAKPVFVDILKENYTMDPNDLKRKITRKTKAVIPVHLYGNVAYVEEIMEISKKHNLYIVEDAAQSLGSSYKNRQTGTFGDIGCYSLYPAKVMTSGEGGVLVTDKKRYYEKLLMIRNHGMVKGYDTKVFGLNLRMPEISAAIAKVQIKKLPKFLSRRRKNAKILTDLFQDVPIRLPQERKHECVNWYLYTITTQKRNKLMKRLNQAGIGATAYYSTPIHKTPLYKRKLHLKITDWAASHVLSLPVHPNLPHNMISFIGKKFRDIYYDKI